MIEIMGPIVAAAWGGRLEGGLVSVSSEGKIGKIYNVVWPGRGGGGGKTWDIRISCGLKRFRVHTILLF